MNHFRKCFFGIALFFGQILMAKTYELTIPEMTCPSCAAAITKALESKLGPIKNSKAVVEKKLFSFEVDDSAPSAKKFQVDEELRTIIHAETGFKVTNISKK